MRNGIFWRITSVRCLAQIERSGTFRIMNGKPKVLESKEMCVQMVLGWNIILPPRSQAEPGNEKDEKEPEPTQVKKFLRARKSNVAF